MNKVFLILFLFCIYIGHTQNMTIDKNIVFSGEGYVLNYTIADSTYLDADISFGFVEGNSTFLDSLCSNFTHWSNQGYTEDDSLFKVEVLKLHYYPFAQRRLREFIYPKEDSVCRESTYLAMFVFSDTLPLKLNKGVYFRIVKVKMEGWLIDFYNFKQLKECYVMTTYDKYGKMRLSPTILKEFEPAFRIDKIPYTILHPKKVLFYSDWILSPKDADLIDFFYKYLYIGPEKEHISYPEALKYLLENDPRQ